MINSYYLSTIKYHARQIIYNAVYIYSYIYCRLYTFCVTWSDWQRSWAVTLSKLPVCYSHGNVELADKAVSLVAILFENSLTSNNIHEAIYMFWSYNWVGFEWCGRCNGKVWNGVNKWQVITAESGELVIVQMMCAASSSLVFLQFLTLEIMDQ